MKLNKKTIIFYAVTFILILLLGIGIGILVTDKGKDSNKSNNNSQLVADAGDSNNKGNADVNNSTGDSNAVDKNSNSIDKNDVGDNTGTIDNSATDDNSVSDDNSTEDKNLVDDKNNSGNGSTVDDKGDTSDKSNTGDNSSVDNSTGDKNSTDKTSDSKDASDKTTEGKETADKTTEGKETADKTTDSRDTADKTSDSKDTSDKKSDDKKSDEKTESPVLTYSSDNSWVSGSTTMYGIQFGITNNSASAISGWTLVMDIEGLSSVDGWNGTFTISGSKMTVTDAGYNKDIYSNGTVVIGCNLGVTASKINIKSATLNGTKMEIKAGKVDQNNQNNNVDNGGNTGNGGNSGNGGNTGNGGNNDQNSVDVSELLDRSKDAVQGDDWLHTDGRKLFDKSGKQVWITGVNWFGYNTGTNLFDGLWNSQLVPTVKAIADHGFNLIRVPISAELINQWASGEYPKANYNNAYNTELNSMNSLEIFDYFLALAEANGIKVMPDIHSAETNAAGHNVNLWYTDRVSVNDYYHALEWMADRYKNNDTIIAYDLKNEPHGKPYEGKAAAIWNDSKASNNWKYVAETAAAKILAKNPNVLIMVEGTEIYPINIKTNSDYHSTDDKDYFFNWWGGNLRAVKDYPIDLGKYQNKLVYSPHDYGPTVFKQPWFEGKYTYDSLMKDCWYDNWFYIYEENIAPLLIGEWGGFMTEPNITWMTYMRQLIKKYHLNHTFWCLNANSGDTGGLLLDDFKTWDTEKYSFVKEVLWQENGKFVGLDHAIALGDNGISLSKASGLK